MSLLLSPAAGAEVIKLACQEHHKCRIFHQLMITNLHPTFPVVGETEIALQHPSFFKFWVLLESNKDITSGFKKMYLPCLLTAKIPDSSDPLFHTRVEADHPSLGILAIQC